ncbi:hypothetical protein QQF64_006099 [Cirrhinus molitorella]|uniref:SPRY-associated domain-containing protein n=1 Tax=Cirrhinus molitorella TaxID=172907 RepID=A0ABR3ME39_9TELE
MTFQAKKDECLKTTQHIKEQTRLTKDLIKKDFEQLRHFLRLEEAARISMLEDEAEMKSEIMQVKLEEVSNNIVSLSNTIQNRETDLEREDIEFLQAYKSYTDSVPYSPQDSNVLASDSLIDVSKHVGNLKFKVWEKMLGQVQYSPIIMDPNTAAKWLQLSENLTSVYYRDLQSDIPDNPERFDLCVCVLDLPTEKLVPFFSPCVSDQGSNSEPLRIMPVKVAVTITPELAD